MTNSALATVIAVWETPYSETVWKDLQNLEHRTENTERPEDILLLGPALPNAEEPRVAEGIVQRNDDRNKIFWGLAVRNAPEGVPPEPLELGDRKIGGRKGLSKVLSDHTPSGMPLTASFRIRLVLERSQWDCRVISLSPQRVSLENPAASLGRVAHLEQIGYRYEGGINGIEEVAIIYFHEEDRFTVSIRGNGLLKLESTTWLPYADEIAEIVMSAFFRPQQVIE